MTPSVPLISTLRSQGYALAAGLRLLCAYGVILGVCGGLRAAPAALAQDYVVVTHVPNENHFIHDPGINILPDGKLIAVCPCWKRAGRGKTPPDGLPGRYTDVMVSDNKGRAWQKAASLPYAEATLLVYGGKVYLLCQPKSFDGIWVAVSEDDGHSWGEPVEVLKGRRFWNCQTGMVIKDGRLYWASGEVYVKMGAVSCDLSQGLLNPAAWSASGTVEMPVPPELKSGAFSDGGNMGTLEGNVVDVQGHLMVLARACINEYGTSNLAAAFDLKEEDGKLNLSFRQFFPIPGGQCKFFILYDAPSHLFWMASNLPVNSQDFLHVYNKYPAWADKNRSLREDRRFLMLSYSLDAINWFPAGCIAHAERIDQSFMYPSMVVDGDDLALLARSARDSGDYHDADLATFHRVKNFRSLAMDITPRL